MLLPKVTFMRIMQQFKKEATHTRSANYIKKLLMLRDLSGPSEAHFINAQCIISFFFLKRFGMTVKNILCKTGASVG